MHIAGKTHHLASQDAQPGHIPFVTVFEQHLQADADTQKRFMARSFHHRIVQSARIQFTHTIRHRPLAGEDHPFRIRNNSGISLTTTFSIRCDLAQGLFDRAQVAHTVILQQPHQSFEL